MLSHKHLHFDTGIGRKKPESIVNRETVCPFCDRDQLTDIIEQRGSIILLRNKYPVLVDTMQTVLIETDVCDAELSTYPKDHLYQVISFGVEKWREMEDSGEFLSVMLFKNHGPLSGGTIHHPHMQIVGLYKHDYQANITASDFEGIVIDQREGVECNLSTKPRVGFYEYNVILSDWSRLNQMAGYVQVLTRWILNRVNSVCKSYNLFFYNQGEKIIVKVVPRFVTSPLFVGYSIPQVPNNLEEVVRELQQTYFR